MDVVAAVIERDGERTGVLGRGAQFNKHVLICQRKRGRRHALKWEFPGGKVEAGESLSEALARELREELGIDARIGEQMAEHEVRYPTGPPLRLHFFRVTEFSGEPRNLEFEQMIWCPRDRLMDYDFLEGDVEFVRKLAGA